MIGHCLLCFHGGVHCINDTRELHQHAIAHELDDTPMVLGDLGVDEIGTQCLESRDRAFLVSPDQPRVADHVSGHNGDETSYNRILCTALK